MHTMIIALPRDFWNANATIYIYICNWYIYIYIYITVYIYNIYISVSARIRGTWNKFREFSGMLCRRQGLSLKHEGMIYVYYVRQVLVHCCATLELTFANEATLHRVERRMIYIYYICIYITYYHIQNMFKT